MIVVGIDPGLDGALALHDGSAIVALIDMPTFAIVRGKTKRRDLDGQTICTWLKEHRPEHVYIEQAQAIPRQSAYATGIFFQVYGQVLGILTAHAIPYTVVPPVLWKRALKVPAGKDAARARASQLFPDAACRWPLKKHDGRAEAALIASYGARELGQRGGSRAGV
jgi:crossover junction endodeoxyribonuclease RuvC